MNKNHHDQFFLTAHPWAVTVECNAVSRTMQVVHRSFIYMINALCKYSLLELRVMFWTTRVTRGECVKEPDRHQSAKARITNWHFVNLNTTPRPQTTSNTSLEKQTITETVLLCVAAAAQHTEKINVALKKDYRPFLCSSHFIPTGASNANNVFIQLWDTQGPLVAYVMENLVWCSSGVGTWHCIASFLPHAEIVRSRWSNRAL